MLSIERVFYNGPCRANATNGRRMCGTTPPIVTLKSNVSQDVRPPRRHSFESCAKSLVSTVGNGSPVTRWTSTTATRPRRVSRSVQVARPSRVERRSLPRPAKCDVVCANCHRLRSRGRHRQWLSSRTQSESPTTASHRVRWRYHEEILDQLRSVPCADCGARFAQCSMDFDHRDPSAKVMRVTLMVGRAGIRRILAEAAKCDIVCANCHRLRTFERRAKQAAERA